MWFDFGNFPNNPPTTFLIGKITHKIVLKTHLGFLMNQSNLVALSATNFDLPSLHILLAEIETALTDAESHLSEFYDDEEQVSLLMDSATVIEQLASIFELIDLKGASDLSFVIAKTLKKLHDSGDNGDVALVMDISEGIMVLDRYVEFVLLREMVEPSLLLPIINKLRNHLHEAPLSANEVASHTSISIPNPDRHYQAVGELGLNTTQLTTAYRVGLGVALTKSPYDLNEADITRLNGMHTACQTIANRSDKLFWQASTALTKDLAKQMPLSNAKKRALIYIEQQLQDYLPIHDRRFADLVGFACEHDPAFAQIARQKYALGQLSESEHAQMHRLLFGPNREITDTLNLLIQAEINAIKEKVDNFSRGDSPNALTTTEIAEHIKDLGSAMHLLGLNDATNTLNDASRKVKAWTSPSTAEFDELLTHLMVAENASIFMAKTHTAGAVKLPLHNRNISLHQLDSAYATLIKEGRINISVLNQAIGDYLADPNRDLLHLQNSPETLQQVSGAMNFLNLNDSAKMLATLAKYMENHLTKRTTEKLPDALLANIADVIVAADYYLEGQEENRPVGKQALLIGQHSLSRVLDTL